MQGKRVDRIAELIRNELGNAVVSRIRDPRVGFVTVTRVEVSADLHYAKVFYSVMGDQEKRNKTQEALTHARGFLQQDLARVLNLRYTPRLDFHLDDSIDHSIEISSILTKIHKDDQPSGHDHE
jgi:ribosome-binding factor A